LRKRLMLSLVLAVVTLLSLIGCNLLPMDLKGIWTQNTESGYEVLEFTQDTFTLTDYSDTFAFEGEWVCSIEKVDRAASHLLMRTTSTSGTLTGITGNGEFSYWYYELDDDPLYVNYSTAGYPSVVAYGPYWSDK
jgi:hypothetical protein